MEPTGRTMRARVKPGPVGFVLMIAMVLLGHWIGLAWLQAQLQTIRPLTLMAEPLFTRILAPTAATLRVAEPRPRHSRVAPVHPPQATGSADANAEAPIPSTSPTLETPSEDAMQTAAPAPDTADPAPEAATASMSEGVAADPESFSRAGEDWPADTRVSYRMTGYFRGDLYGSGRVQWQRAQDRYQVRVELLAALVLRVSMTSQGQVTDAGLVPGDYEEQMPGRRQGVVFEAETLRFQDGARQLKPYAVQDTASQFVELTRRFSTGREILAVGSQVQVWLARPSGMALWTYDVVAEDTLQTPELGPVQAFHLRPRPIANPRGVITAELWFAPALQYLPVRVRISLGSENFVDLMVERIEQADAPAPTPETQTPGSAALP
jgi:hypothetical protein